MHEAKSNTDVFRLLAQAMGFEATGLELGKDAIEFGRSVLGVSLAPHTIDRELEEKGPGSYDVVSYFMVLEHVADLLPVPISTPTETAAV